uniref:Cationic amino acid transporter-1 uORF n=1 Tax=Rattus norvegicus TaxID=10116 RepID=Q8R5I1_RAT|nr:cationic amino acid transporter-1 uORF [Rattus norvegicus]
MKPARIPPACAIPSASRCERLSARSLYTAQHPDASSPCRGVKLLQTLL